LTENLFLSLRNSEYEIQNEQITKDAGY